MTNKDILYLVMFYILKQKDDNKTSDLFDLYDLVLSVCDDYRYMNNSSGYFTTVLGAIRKRCLPLRCAKTVFSFCKFVEKINKICN